MKCLECQAGLPGNAELCGVRGQPPATERESPRRGGFNPRDPARVRSSRFATEPSSGSASAISTALSGVPTPFAGVRRCGVEKSRREEGRPVHSIAVGRVASFRER